MNAPETWTPRKTARVTQSTPGQTESAEPPRFIGRFSLIESVGRGGMGEVFRAYDPELRREVAIKLLSQTGPQEQQHMLREARALAALSHPNIVTVFDVGWCGDRVFLAMELIEGTSLREWLADTPRSVRDVCDVFAALADGLAAAHDAGLVHGDIKPENAMVASDGRVIVLDFGLAHRAEVESGAGQAAQRLAGTPRYMAPEQFDGGAVTAKADQFSFAVSLYSALYERYPFDGSNTDEISESVRGGRLVAPPARRHVPRRLRSTLSQALSSDPGDRLPSMRSLANVLRDAARSKRRLLVGLGVVAAGLAAVAVAGAGTDTCAYPDHWLGDVWTDEIRSDVLRGFEASGSPLAAESYRRVSARLDTYVGQLGAAYVDTCEATHVRREQSPELLDLRMRCLHDRAKGAQALVSALRTPDETLVTRATQATTSLADLDACDDPEYVGARYPAPRDPDTAAQLKQLGTRVAQAEAARTTGKPRRALEIATELAEPAAALEYPPIHARTQHALARALMDLGRFSDAQAAFVESGSAATVSGDYVGTVEALSGLAWSVAKQGEYDAALAYIKSAEIALARTPADSWLRRGPLVVQQEIYAGRGELELAQERANEELALATRRWGADHEWTARAHYNVALSGSKRGDLALAATHFERSRVLFLNILGASHPRIGWIHNALGEVERKSGNLEAATDHYHKAIKVFENALGDEHLNVSFPLHNLAVVAQTTGDWDNTLRYSERAVAIREGAHGPDHPGVGRSLIAFAMAKHRTGEPDQAETLYRRALAIFERVDASTHVAETLANLGALSLEQGKREQGCDELERGLALWQARGPEHPSRAYTLAGLGNCERARGNFAKAVEYYEEVLRVSENHVLYPGPLGSAQFGLAQALRKQGRASDRDRAETLARQARANYVAVKGDVREIDAWLQRQ